MEHAKKKSWNKTKEVDQGEESLASSLSGGPHVPTILTLLPSHSLQTEEMCSFGRANGPE